LLLGCAANAARGGYAADPGAVAAKAEGWPAETATHAPGPVTKEDYRRTSELFFEGVKSSTEYCLKQPKPYPNLSFNIDNALWHARMHHLSADEQYAEAAAQCIEHAHRLIVEPQTDVRNTSPGWRHVRELYWIDRWLSKSPGFTDRHRRQLRDIALKACPAFPKDKVEYGAFNRPFGAALSGEALLALIPDAPDAAQWRTYIGTVWSYWWRRRDNDESTDHYNALWFRYLLDWVEIRGCSEEFWRDSGIRNLMERYLYQVFPMGAFPHYSDSCGWNVSWGHWVRIFEACATAYRDGRFKWAAHRIYEYGTSRIENIRSWAYTGSEAGWSLLHAWVNADDSIPERPRHRDVALLRRHKVVMRPEAERKRTRQFLDVHDEMAPDKLVFYGGHHRDALSLLVDVVGDAGHSHARRPAILALADRQSVLLMSLGYMERRAEDHNLPAVVDYEGYPYDNTPYHLKSDNNVVKDVACLDLGPLGYGLVRIDKCHGYPATLRREIVFVKTGAVVVKDVLEFGVELKLRWGPVYRARNLGPDHGPNWANTYLGGWIPLRGLGRGAPVYTRWRNSPRDLLIYFLPGAQGTLEIADEAELDKTCPLPLRVQYAQRQTAAPDRPVHCTSLLLPHAPGPAAPLAEKVTAILDDPHRTVLRFATPDGARHLVVLNRRGAMLEAGEVRTDATIAYVCERKGKPSAAALHGGARLTLRGANLAPLARPAQAHVVPAGQ